MTTTAATKTVTILQTGSPSRSKQAGPCWVAVGDTYAATTVRSIETAAETVTVTGKVTLRRSTRTSTERQTWTLAVTGDPADTLDLSIGSPQSVDVTLTGVRQ